ncbi:TonB-dependent receptor [Pseudolysobacter antarcticus]|uniref:TonB-dependent receptor n=1 Tax=Pseudolysobacter antarcticus TaxID=2511995 RepID=A0A411HNW1_9GAMM|nr:TonB-dependent receptor [Pseudolysobacter antarcticus]QBB72175.1 TonB-dependent receptor [Pseudolysobacter antarcticus]
MNAMPRRLLSVSVISALLLPLYAAPVLAQQNNRGGDDTQKLEAVNVTGSRIKKAEVEGQSPVITITAKDIEDTGLGSIGDVIQRLSVSGSSLNTKFNSAGNFGFPPDGGGVGSGSTTISLRNLGAKRALVLVDGLRWVPESSASGVSAAVDLNTIPASIVERIEILTDGASSLYGSDAIAGVINIITKKKQDGIGLHIYGANGSVGDGKTYSGNISLGASGEKFDFFMDISHFKQDSVSSGDWAQSSFPVPGIGLAGGSSATPRSRVDFTSPGGPNFDALCPEGVCDLTAIGKAPAGGLQAFPGGYKQWGGSVDRFNFAPFNLLQTPSDRTGIFAQGTYHITDTINFSLKGLYNTRDSQNQAAPEPIFLGNFCAALDLCSRVGVDVTNPYNPFGITLSPNDPNWGMGRRPIEGGPRIFKQSVDTRYVSATLNGTLQLAGHDYSWDVNFVDSDNKADQTVTGTYNIRHILNALGPVSACTAPCVPLNVFGGPGTITPEMLKYILFTENDRSDEKLKTWSANISGDLFALPAGALTAAAGYEHRRNDGSYSPDSVVIAGDSNGVPSGATTGGYSTNEYYVELNAPLIADVTGIKHLDLSVASRYSDYSNFGGTTNNKLGLRWQVFDDLTFRSTWAEGFRAPSIGELYSSFSRFDANLIDPCNGATGVLGSNCHALGIANPATFAQLNPQISVITGGAVDLQPETSTSLTLGGIYSPGWAESSGWSQKLDFDVNYYKIHVDNSIQAPDAQTQLNRCAQTLDPVYCTGITRNAAGQISGFNNILRNLGRIDTNGIDVGLNWTLPDTSVGRFGAGIQTTYTMNYKSTSQDTGLIEPKVVGVESGDSGIPRIRSTFNVNWALADFTARWTLRYMSALKEDCGSAGGAAICGDNVNPNGSNVAPNRPDGTNRLGATTYHDIRASWKVPVKFNMLISAGVNNLLDKDPPVCLSCSLNGYDASNYDLPGRFSYVEASIKF